MSGLIWIAICLIVWGYGFYRLFIYKEEKNTTKIWCTECNNDLCSGGSFISDTYDDDGENHVKYKCVKCGDESDYNFDIMPAPINWDELKGANSE